MSVEKIIYLNQAGFLPNGCKRAVCSVPVKDFAVENEQGQIILEKSAHYLGYDEASGDEVYEMVFTEVTNPGTYSIVVNTENGELGRETFVINQQIADDVLNVLCKAYYYLRCGQDLIAPYAEEFTHKACHCCQNVKLWDEREIELKGITGGWHDAGDYGRYVTAGAVAVAHLLWAYRMFPQAFEHQHLNIPEGDQVAALCNDMPDILWECRYELEWLLKMQRSDGGVYHKLTTALHAPFIMPEEDKEQLYLFSVSSIATADLAAVTALAAEIYRSYDSVFAAKLAEAAKKSGRWLQEHTEFIGFKNPEGCNTGPYGEWRDVDNRLWAATSLFELTGELSWLKQIEQSMEENEFSAAELGYGSVAGLAYLGIIHNRAIRKDAKIYKMAVDSYVEEAKKMKGLALSNGYRAAMHPEQYVWGSNMILMQHAMIMIIADVITDSNQYSALISNQADVLLGCNPLGFSYVSGVGSNCLEHPHLRPSSADGIDRCIPGMVSGGPNRHRSDPKAKELIEEGTSPMKCFADHDMCYSLNEITIYWNSPAVFTYAYLALKNK